MRLMDHWCVQAHQTYVDTWYAQCACGWDLSTADGCDALIDFYVAHVIGQFAIDRPPVDVIEDARRAFEQRQGR